MLRVVAEPSQILAPRQASQPEPRFVGDRDHEPAAADTCQLGKRLRRLREVLEHLEAEDELEAVVLERQ